MKKAIISIFMLSVCALNAQEIFLTKGKIEFEKQINIFNLMKDMEDGDEDNSFTDLFKSQMPKTKTFYFDLLFSDNKSLYKPGREETGASNGFAAWYVGIANENIVYKDLAKDESVSRKVVYDNTFLLQDSLRKAVWKITGDTRTIAGFECKRATTVIMDSVFVVAFYTDQIIPSTGPESFGGLQGMILGLAVPRLHTTWYATKVEILNAKDEQQIAPPTKGKKITKPELKEQLDKRMKDWGKTGKRNIWQVNL
jgi:GLPGLI family protein